MSDDDEVEEVISGVGQDKQELPSLDEHVLKTLRKATPKGSKFNTPLSETELSDNQPTPSKRRCTPQKSPS